MLVPNTDLLEGLQPMEVAQAETTSTVEAQAMDDPPSARFTWTIDNFSRLNTKMLYSDVFLFGGYKWRILVFPKGNDIDYLSMYLDVADSTILPYGWSRYTQFSLSVINQIHNKYSIRKETQHQFNARENDWGFTSFMPLGELYDPGRGYLVNDTCTVEADVGIRLKKEQKEKEQKRKEKAEAHLYTIIKVARNEDLLEQIGKDIYFDLVDHDKVHSFRIQKQISFNLFKEEVAKELGIPVQFQRFWLWAKRQNHTYRPNRPLTPQEEAQSVGQLREVSDKANNAELKLFLEVELGQDLQPVPPPERTKEDILLFFKLYDPSKEELRYVGRLFVKVSGKPVEILPKLNEMAGFSADEEIELYEEIKFEPAIICECIDKTCTFRVSQLEDGDIVCFQKSPQVGSSDQYRYPDVPSFLDYAQNRQVVESVPRAQTKTKVTPSTQEASVQEMTSNEKTESNAKRGDSNRVYVENPQKKEDFARATSKDQEGESTQTDSDPLFSLLSPDLRATCSQLLSKYPEMMKDTNKWTLSLRGFLLGQIGFVVSQLQSKGKENCLDLPFDAFLSTLSEAEGLSVNVGWLKSRVTTLRDLKKAGSSVHSSLSSLRELRAKESSCINKANETESALEVHGTSITQLQESINRLKVELTSKQEVNSALQAQLEGVTAERSYLRKEIEKLEGELGALSHPDFSFENISSLTNII